MAKDFTLEELFQSLKKKAQSKDKNSYTAQLVSGGVEKISRKIGEEAVEVMIAAFLNEKKKSKKTHQELVGEICDLFYHNLVLMTQQKIEFDEILEELNTRNKKKK